METIDIDDSAEFDMPALQNAAAERKKPTPAKVKSAVNIMRKAVLTLFIICMAALAFEFSRDAGDIGRAVAENSIKFNKALKSNYDISAEELADIETAAGDEEIDALLDWEDKGTASAAATNNAPVAAAPVAATTPAVNVAAPVNEPVPVAPQVDKVENNEASAQNDKPVPAEPVADKPKVETASAPEVLKPDADRLTKLEEELAKLTQAIEKNGNNGAVNSQLNLMLNEMVAVKRQVEVFSNKVIELDDKITAMEKSKVAASSKPASTAPAKKKSSSSWQLKSAKGDVAWVAKRGSSDIIAVTVGDDLEGMGNIEEIGRNGSGKWYVKAQKGTISQ